MRNWSAFAAGGVAAALASGPARRIARRSGLVSRPGGLNPEPAPVPLAGGVTLLAGAGPLLLGEDRALLAPMLAGLTVGTVDDVVDVPAPLRALAWASVGAALAGEASSALEAAAVTTVAVAGVNFLDGIDGLATGVAAAAAAGLTALDGGSAAGAALAGALLGFLPSNRPPASAYLGNGGATLVGCWLAAAALRVPRASRPRAIALCLLVPACEVAATAVRRRRACDGMFVRERGHGYDQLVARGVPVAAVVACYAGVQLLASLAAVRGRALVLGAAAATGALVWWSNALRPPAPR
jgi:UDP-N-acetylmuramyl pentapeptide phosphotransferase/UDP-N-acetylglucosamine-1-phosphate transferase